MRPQGEGILNGLPAASLRQYEVSGQTAAYESTFTEATFVPRLLRLKLAEETYQVRCPVPCLHRVL